MLKFSASIGRINMELATIEMGKDLCVVITGGDYPHLGAVAIAQARPSRQDSSKLSATTSTITLLGHQEDEIAKNVAQQVAVHTGNNVVVSCGIHLEQITAAEITEVQRLSEQLLSELLTSLKQRRGKN